MKTKYWVTQKSTPFFGVSGATQVFAKQTYFWIPNKKSDSFGPILSKILLSEKIYLYLCSIQPNCAITNIFCTNYFETPCRFIIDRKQNFLSFPILQYLVFKPALIWQKLCNQSWFLILTRFYLHFIFLMQTFGICIFYIKQIIKPSLS